MTSNVDRANSSSQGAAARMQQEHQSSECGEFHIVGIGASAGGLEPIERLFARLPDDTGAAYVLVQHLSPDFKSHMEELLGRHTDMPIHRVENAMEVERNHVYLIPPKKEMVISEGRLLLTDKSAEKSLSHPIDQFFRSLAADIGRYAIGVILSGTGSDGSRGIRDIHEAGGLVLAQDETTAAFDGMPLNAQSTGAVDLVLAPVGIADAIVRYIRDGLSAETMREDDVISVTSQGLERILELLHEQHGLDFSHYKSNTVTRRLQRRIDLLGLADVEAYVEHVSDDSEELNGLYKDLLIGVTKFFRDPEAFEVLETEAIPKLFNLAKSGREIRVWVCGCATGEEAYSIAMLLDEVKRREQSNVDFKIFATDAHHVSLNAAARGVFQDEALEGLSDERRNRYFERQRDGFHVRKELRRYIVFAPHNVISDAPFTQMDLVTCRNLLIYLQPTAQKKALSLFHFALRSNGVLFLGPSESTGELSDEFETIDKRWRVYEKRRDIRLPLDARVPFGTNVDISARLRPSRALRNESRIDVALVGLYDKLLDRKMSPSVLTNEDFTIQHVFGGAERYLQVRGGRPTTNLLDNVIEQLKAPLTGALQHAIRKDDVVRYTGIRVSRENAVESIALTVEPIVNPADNSLSLLVEFDREDVVDESRFDESIPVDVDELTQERVAGLESELRYTQENLQATIEEMETANEELQAANEELIASNEELQSTNEELHSVNEELFTVNTENQRRVEELAEANADMDNLLATTQVGVIFLDRDLHIRRFTPEMARLFHLIEQDIGRPFESFVHNFDRAGMLNDLNSVLEQEKEREFEVSDRSGNQFLARVLPYRRRNEIEGVVLTLINIASLKQAQIGLQQFQFITESAADGISLVDRDARFHYVNPSMCQTLGYSAEELLDMQVMDVNPLYDLSRFTELFDKAIHSEIKPFEAQWKKRSGEIIPVEITCSSVLVDNERLMCGQIRDITDRQEAERKLRVQQMAVEAALDGVIIADARQEDRPITFANDGFLRLTGYTKDEVIGRNCRFLQGPKSSSRAKEQIRKAIESGEPCQVTILNYRKDGTTFWNDLQITPVFDEAGELANFIGVQHDVTSRVETQRELKKQSDRLESILDSAAEGIFGLNEEGICSFCNHSALRILGYDEEAEVLGEPLLKIIQATRSDGVKQSMAETTVMKAIARGEPVTIDDEIFLRRDGSACHVTYQSRPKIRDGRCCGAVVTFQDISDRRLLVSELQVLGKLVDSSTDAIITWNLDGGIVSWNTGAEKLYGYTAKEAVGRVTHELLQSKHPDGFGAIREKLLEVGDWTGEIEHTRKDGRRITVSSRHQLMSTEGAERRVLEINRDMTEAKAIRSELESAKQVAQLANQAKSDFLANMSHELRTPMTAVLGYTDLITNESNDENILDRAETIRRNGEYLLSLLNDILDLSKIEAGKMDFAFEPVDIPAVISDVLSLMNVRAQQKGIPLTLAYQTEIPREVTGDRVRIRQVLVNLLSNAIKFTEKGEVKLEIRLDAESDPATLRFAVRDTGIGMSPEQVNELFKPFVRVGDTRHQVSGTGLGLNISRRLANEMSGEITVESELEVGSVFTFRLPVANTELEDLVDPSKVTSGRSETAYTPPAVSLDGLRILLADDHEEIRFLPEYFLSTRNAEVTVACNGKEAVEEYLSAESRGEAFDIILMDMQMPVLNGSDAVKELRRLGCETPIIALTAQVMAGDADDAIKIGCNAHLPKPFDGPQLLQLIADLV